MTKTDSVASQTRSTNQIKVRSQRRRRRTFRGVAYAFMVCYALITLFPFYILFVRTFVSTKDATALHLWIPRGQDMSMQAEIGNLAVNYNIDIKKLKEDMGIKGYVNPRDTLAEIAAANEIPVARFQSYFTNFGTFNGWITLLGRQDYWRALGRTMATTLISIILLCFLSMLTGYGLAGLRRRDQVIVYHIYLLQMVIPTVLIIIPQFLLIQMLIGLAPGSDQPGPVRSLAQLTALVLIFIKGGALSTMVFTTSINQIPQELEESAQLDGAGRMAYFWRVLVPLMKVPIATVSVIMLPVFWNAFFEPYVYLDANNATVLPLIAAYGGTFTTNFQIIFTGVFVSVMPLLIVYLLLRRLFIRSVMAGAIKG
ncbi:MAG: carbohydrate ABC transporter permease [Caldilineaceae bacterium]|nr:carbohydrate ABC transporter permease [Caldilineaceae bacterium]